jgi:hypothetical protein
MSEAAHATYHPKMRKSLSVLVLFAACADVRVSNRNASANLQTDRDECARLAAEKHANDDPARFAGGTMGLKAAVKLDADQCLRDHGWAEQASVPADLVPPTPPGTTAAPPRPRPDAIPPVNGNVATENAATVDVTVDSKPGDGEVYVDGAFLGTAPAHLRLTPGVHAVEVRRGGYETWTRQLTVVAGTPAHVVATLNAPR